MIFSVAYAYYCGFMFGWHVHEKACLHFLIPLSLVAVKSLKSAQELFFLSIGDVFLCRNLLELIVQVILMGCVLF